jgi:DNA uptake protein ComE-like DNA-binding protein
VELDKKTVAGAVAAVAVGAIGAAVAYTALSGEEADSNRNQKKPSSVKAKPAAPTGAISINQASRDELMSLKHIGKARAKRILMSRPFKSVDDLLSRGLLPEDVLTRHRDRLKV